MSKFLNEFKEFAMRGNVLEMAVGVIIGGDFGKSRISIRSFSAALGSGAFGASGSLGSSFLLANLLNALMSMKIQKDTMRKTKQVWRKLQ